MFFLACTGSVPQVQKLEGVALQVLSPEQFRYGDHAPVVVQVMGMHERAAATLSTDAEKGLLEAGMIVVSWLVPGECDGELCTAGEWEDRGAATTETLLKVLDWVEAKLPLMIPEADTSNIGLLSLSRGGVTAWKALCQQPLPVAWWAAWEAPVGDQFISEELGRIETNPGYQYFSCEGTVCPVDWSGLGFAQEQKIWLKDPNDSAQVSLQGAFYLDQDGSGSYTPSDFILEPHLAEYQGEKLGFFSTELSEFLKDQLDVPYATPERAAAFWAERDVSLEEREQLWQYNPKLQVMILAGLVNHIAAPRDHPHIFTLWQELWGQSFVQLNPSSKYLPRDNAISADTSPDYLTMLLALTTASAPDLWRAGAEELADRIEE
jgi:hypothetical protein